MAIQENENTIDLEADGEIIYRITITSPSGLASQTDIAEFLKMLEPKIFGLLKENGIKTDCESFN